MSTKVIEAENPYEDALQSWWLGEVVAGHEIGPYRIVEYHPRIAKGCTVTREIDYSTVHFSLFVEDGLGQIKDRSEGYHSLDAALAGGIAYRAEGCNHRADRYFMAALDSMRVKDEDVQERITK